MNNPVVQFALFLVYRFVQSVLLLFSTTFIIFLLVDSAPNAPLTVSPEVAEQLDTEQTDDSFLTRYMDWLFGDENSEGVLNGDFGTSFVSRQPVSDMIEERTDATFELLIPALLLSLTGGTIIGMVMGAVRHGFIDQLIRPVVIFAAAMPVFWLGLVLIYRLGVKAGDFPLSGRCDLSITDGCEADFDHLFLPVTSLIVFFTAAIALYIRAVVVELEQLSFARIIMAVLRGIPAAFAALLAKLISALVLIEAIFSWPGLGRTAFQAAAQLDFPLLTGIIITTTLWVISAYFVMSVLYAVFNLLFRRPMHGYVVTTQPYFQGVAEEQTRTRKVKPLGVQMISDLFTGLAVLILAGIVLTAIGASVITDKDPATTSPEERLLKPGSEGHLLGTDDLGRDVLVRLLHGSRNTLSISVRAAFISLGIGLIVGFIGGISGGIFNKPVNFFMNLGVLTVLSIPTLLLLILFIIVERTDSPGEFAMLLGLVCWPALVPIVRAKIREIRDAFSDGIDLNETIIRAITGGIMVVAFGLVYCTAAALLLLSALDFLGVGVRPPTPTWGNMLTNTPSFMQRAPDLLTWPGLMVTAAAFSLFMIAERLRDSFHSL